MTQLLRIGVVIVIFASGVARSRAQPTSTTPSSQAPEEAVQLSQVVVRLYGEGKYREAVAPAERALALLEKALGPNHPSVAASLNNLAELCRAQGAYAKAEPLHARALAIREKALGPNHAALATMDSRIAVSTTRAALRRLDALLLAPIRAQLSGITHLIVAPDGKLNLVPFEALIDPQGRYALDSYLVSYVSSGRDLLRLALPQRPRSSAVLIAGPDYGPVPRSPAPDQLTFTQLAGATAEATDLQRYFPTAAITGKKASKAALTTLVGPAMLHVATHCFYGWRAGLAGAATRGVAFTPSPWFDPLRGSIGAPPPTTHDLSDALDQAGLAMADANRGPTGIVTAREIAGFDWTGTQLVVLSACQTGIGAVASGDGVYGLRRALVLAGAASQVVSLWSVADASTAALMRDYYAQLKQGIGRADALRRAKQHLLRQPGYAHPFYWAAFIPAGDWRPLDKRDFSPRNLAP